MDEPCFRSMTAAEGKLVDALLTPEFPGCHNLRRQVVNAEVRTIDQNGSFEFRIDTEVVPANDVKYAVPSEGELIDSDGQTLHVLLHARNNLIRMVEIYKEDLSRPLIFPEAHKLQVFAPQ